MQIKRQLLMVAILAAITMLNACGTIDPASQNVRIIKSGAPLPVGESFGTNQSKEYDQPPILTSGDMPIYPISKALSGKSGAAVIAFTIGEDGKTRDLSVKDTSGEVYSRHAMIAIREWRFQPALKNGAPVAVRTQQTILFTTY
jgi:periplasmic protein TonB